MHWVRTHKGWGVKIVPRIAKEEKQTAHSLKRYAN